jgi:hypothetical protein
MRNPSPAPGAAARESRETETEGDGSAAPGPTGQGAGDSAQAAQGSLPEPVPASENPAPAKRADSPAEAEGRRTLSTAFVRVGPDGHLTVELRDGRAVVLRDVVMGPRDYCGVQVLGGSAGKRYCGGYGDIAAARPGGGPAPGGPIPVSLNPVELERSPSKRE